MVREEYRGKRKVIYIIWTEALSTFDGKDWEILARLSTIHRWIMHVIYTVLLNQSISCLNYVTVFSHHLWLLFVYQHVEYTLQKEKANTCCKDKITTVRLTPVNSGVRVLVVVPRGNPTFLLLLLLFFNMTTAKSASYDHLIKLLLIGDSGK